MKPYCQCLITHFDKRASDFIKSIQYICSYSGKIFIVDDQIKQTGHLYPIIHTTDIGAYNELIGEEYCRFMIVFSPLKSILMMVNLQCTSGAQSFFYKRYSATSLPDVQSSFVLGFELLTGTQKSTRKHIHDDDISTKSVSSVV